VLTNLNRQFYLIRPAPLAQALELEKGEEIEWIIEDKATLLWKRPANRTGPPPGERRRKSAW
jgi:hypothetical protein